MDAKEEYSVMSISAGISTGGDFAGTYTLLFARGSPLNRPVLAGTTVIVHKTHKHAKPRDDK